MTKNKTFKNIYTVAPPSSNNTRNNVSKICQMVKVTFDLDAH